MNKSIFELIPLYIAGIGQLFFWVIIPVLAMCIYKIWLQKTVRRADAIIIVICTILLYGPLAMHIHFGS